MSNTQRTTLASAREKAQMRRQVILDDLRRYPLSSGREICDRILEETGGAPAIVTGAIYIAAQTALNDLNALHREGKVYKFKTPGTRVVSWQVAA